MYRSPDVPARFKQRDDCVCHAWAQEKQKTSSKVEPLEAIEEAVPAKQSDDPPKPAKDLGILRAFLATPAVVEYACITLSQASRLLCVRSAEATPWEDNYMEPDKVVIKSTPIDDDDGNEPEDLAQEGKDKDDKKDGVILIHDEDAWGCRRVSLGACLEWH